MAKIKIGNLYGTNIYIGNPQELRNGEYWVSVSDRKINGIYRMVNGNLTPVSEKEVKETRLQDIEILNNYHGKKETITPSEGFDGIGKVTFKKPKLEEKDAIKITKNGITEIKVGKNYDGLDDITIIVNVENE